MPLQNHLTELERKHQALEREIQDALAHPSTDDIRLAELKRRKLDTIEALAPQVIAAGNIGCMMQIGSATAVPVVHTAELLDWATGGPAPRALRDG